MRMVPSPTSRVVLSLLATLLTVSMLGAGSASAVTPPAPGNFTGYGFDACSAPSQKTMDVWNLDSPFSAIGIYISGNSRYCGDKYQPNLTKAWVQKNADNGWHFMPIHVGYQSPCFKNNPSSRVQKKLMSKSWPTARAQARSDAQESMAAATRLGLPKGSVLYLDMEWWSRDHSSCDNAVREFEDSWTETLHAAGFKSGLYSSGSAAIKLTDELVAAKRAGFTPPDHLWSAWTSGHVASTAGGGYIGDTRWTNHQRIHQYWNGVDVSYAGSRINIDKNFLDVGVGSRPTSEPLPCTMDGKPVRMSFTKYPNVTASTTDKAAIAAVQCLLKQLGLKSSINGIYGTGTRNGINTFRARHGWSRSGLVSGGTWASLFAAQGTHLRVQKYGTVGDDVWNLQRALVAAGKPLTINGLFNSATVTAAIAYRKKNGLAGYATVESAVWSKLDTGHRG